MLSRVFGLIRDQLFAALLGAGFYSDAFIIAFRIPNLLRDLFAEGALSSAFVPTFTAYEVKKSSSDAWALANLLIGFLLVVIGALTLVGVIFAPELVSLIAPGFDAIPGKADLTVLLTRIMFPFLPIIAISALFMGMLNVKESFGVPAFAPVMFNIVSILFGLALWTAGVPPRTAVIGWSVGTLCGGFAQGLIQIPPLWRHGWRPRITIRGWRHSSGLKQITLLMLPATVGLAATQINIWVNSIFASFLEQGSPSWLNYAFRLMQLPIGIFGVAIGVVTLPRVSRDAATDSSEAIRSNLTSALSLVVLLTLPAAFGLWILGIPIIRLIYEHGAFHAGDTSATAAALAFYAVGLPAYAAVKVLAPAFYALKDARSPMIASLTAVGLNIAFNVLTYRTLGYRGLALGTSIAAAANLTMLLFWFQRKHIGIDLISFASRVFRILVASIVMAVIASFGFYRLSGMQNGFLGHLIETFVPMIAAALVYFAALRLLRVPETDLLMKVLKKIYGRFFSR